MEQRSEKTDSLGSERDVDKRSYLQSFSPGGGISQSNISGGEKGRWQQASNQTQKSKQVCALPTLQNGGFALSEILITGKRLHVQNRLEGRVLQCTTKQGFPEISKDPMGRKPIRVPVPLFWARLRQFQFQCQC